MFIVESLCGQFVKDFIPNSRNVIFSCYYP